MPREEQKDPGKTKITQTTEETQMRITQKRIKKTLHAALLVMLVTLFPAGTASALEAPDISEYVIEPEKTTVYVVLENRSGVTGYEFCISTPQRAEQMFTIDNPSHTKVSIEGLKTGATYKVKARCIGKDGTKGPYSYEITITPGQKIKTSAVRISVKKNASDSKVAAACLYGTKRGQKGGGARLMRGKNAGATGIPAAAIKAKYKLDTSLAYFHGGWYTAKMTGTQNCQAADGGADVTVDKGTPVIVMRASHGNGTVCRLSGGRTVYISASHLRYTGYIYNSSKAYSNAQVTQWVNDRNIPRTSSYTSTAADYLLLASKYNQHVWIFKWNGDKWVVVKDLSGGKCSTACRFNGGHPNDVYGFSTCGIYNYSPSTNGRHYSQPNGGNDLHSGGKGKPQTSGCIALNKKALKWVMKKAPYGTRVVLF